MLSTARAQEKLAESSERDRAPDDEGHMGTLGVLIGYSNAPLCPKL